jgi:MSHA pilin protein MshD
MCTSSLRCSSNKSQSGISLVELILFIVIVGVALAGILLVMNQVSARSADPLIRKQALAIAESILEEVELMPFTFCDPNDANAATALNDAGCAGVNQDNAGGALGPVPAGELRADAGAPFDNVADYAGMGPLAAADITGALYPGYTVAVAMARVGVAFLGAAAADALQITVTVIGPGGETIVLDGYRTRYAPRL